MKRIDKGIYRTNANRYRVVVGEVNIGTFDNLYQAWHARDSAYITHGVQIQAKKARRAQTVNHKAKRAKHLEWQKDNGDHLRHKRRIRAFIKEGTI